MKIGTFISDVVVSPIDEPVEVVYAVDKAFIDEIYKFMLVGEKTMRNLQEYFDSKHNYKSKGMHFDADMVELFVEQHRK